MRGSDLAGITSSVLLVAGITSSTLPDLLLAPQCPGPSTGTLRNCEGQFLSDQQQRLPAMHFKLRVDETPYIDASLQRPKCNLQ